ncbi:hypothetical protein TTE2072 [Caldanaerobacter subterraneus subsp. tengcongensis MB4]|uniref:Uncharacterized protein n=2 Tax=Thermoanaerobacteraceae TaxID=186814 RepID=Q8R8D4_CALS4|nr:hypothetical protein TTE2072 [Caldanaerobacter subterraneus subsp. tengcongensis MB4]
MVCMVSFINKDKIRAFFVNFNKNVSGNSSNQRKQNNISNYILRENYKKKDAKNNTNCVKSYKIFKRHFKNPLSLLENCRADIFLTLYGLGFLIPVFIICHFIFSMKIAEILLLFLYPLKVSYISLSVKYLAILSLCFWVGFPSFISGIGYFLLFNRNIPFFNVVINTVQIFITVLVLYMPVVWTIKFWNYSGYNKMYLIIQSIFYIFWYFIFFLQLVI